MNISKRSSDNRGSMNKLFFRVLYSFIGSVFMLFGGLFLYAYWMSPFRELIYMLIGVPFVASGFWMVYRLAYKPSDKMEISTRIATIIGSALILHGGFFLYVYWMSPFRELIFMLIGVTFVASGFWMVYRLAYKPSDKMEISTRIATILIVIAWFATINYYMSPIPPETSWYLSIHKVDYEPEHYFVLDEEMETYPLFRLALDKMEAEGTSWGSIEITREEMKKVPIGFGYFKYESNFYTVSVFHGHG